MSFTTVTYFLFLLLVYISWRYSSHRNGLKVLCLASFIFYSYWYPPFLLILLTSGVVDYFAAKKMVNSSNRKKWLIFSIFVNLSILGFFKYFNFFLDTVFYLFLRGNEGLDPFFIHLILPMGISFYTFQSMSYTIDVYRQKLKPCANPLDFFVYLSFFPQLVAGPIVRAVDFIPQLSKKIYISWDEFQYVVFRITRGLFLKMVIADNIAGYVDRIFSTPTAQLGIVGAWVGVVGFSIQILCDFSGYSDIAIGSARLFGLKLNENFNNPYFAVSLREFWGRWHISLSTWFRDYLYIPLGGNKKTLIITSINILTVFIISGLWHGAKITFVVWGVIHGLVILIERIFELKRGKRYNWTIFKFFITLIIIQLAWVMFRSQSIAYALGYWKEMFLGEFTASLSGITSILFIILCFIMYQIYLLAVEKKFILITKSTRFYETVIYFLLILTLGGKTSDFIYFQF